LIFTEIPAPPLADTGTFNRITITPDIGGFAPSRSGMLYGLDIIEV